MDDQWFYGCELYNTTLVDDTDHAKLKTIVDLRHKAESTVT
jgi:hypothetical protein